jgi:hypothetical protein
MSLKLDSGCGFAVNELVGLLPWMNGKFVEKKKKKFIYFGERVIFKWNEEKNEEFDVVEVC